MSAQGQHLLLIYSLLSLKMQVYLNDDTKFENMGIKEMKKQNKYGIMYGFAKRLDLITTEYVGDYHVFHSENGKSYLCVDNDCQMGVAIGKIQEAITREKGFQFKAAKNKLYIKIDKEQANALPKHMHLLISTNVYGVFLQAASNLAFVQFEVSGYRHTPRVDFNALNSDDNATFP